MVLLRVVQRASGWVPCPALVDKWWARDSSGREGRGARAPHDHGVARTRDVQAAGAGGMSRHPPPGSSLGRDALADSRPAAASATFRLAAPPSLRLSARCLRWGGTAQLMARSLFVPMSPPGASPTSLRSVRASHARTRRNEVRDLPKGWQLGEKRHLADVAEVLAVQRLCPAHPSSAREDNPPLDCLRASLCCLPKLLYRPGRPRFPAPTLRQPSDGRGLVRLPVMLT